MTKKWWKSKTVWFNGAIAVLAIVEANLRLFSAGMDPLYYALLATGIGVANVGLRFITTQAIRA